MKTKYLIPVLSTALLWGCNKEKADTTSPSPSNPSIELYSSEGINVKVSFAKVIAKAVANPAVRQLLTDKASLQFDKDYDVLYHQIKDEKVADRTLDEYIKELSSESDYKLFSRSPLLTVFIPHIQQTASKVASAAPTIPWIAVRDHNDKLVAYNSAGESKELDPSVLPQFPVMVVKENERVVYENNVKKEAQKGRFLFESEGNRYYLYHDEFDGTAVDNTPSLSQARTLHSPSIDPTIQTAWNYYKTCNNCPQRDWIYYGINVPSGAVQGEKNIKYAEAITAIHFSNKEVFTDIGGWDEGNYELFISIFYSGPATGVFASSLKTISATPDQMFTWLNGALYGVKDYWPSSLITIAPWDMQAFGNRWAVKVEEYDPQVKKTASFSNTSTYGTNFKVDVSSGSDKVIKIGSEFGATTTSTKVNTFTYETTDANDILGDGILSWTDPIVIRQDPWRDKFYTYMNTVNTGRTAIGIETIRIAQ